MIPRTVCAIAVAALVSGCALDRVAAPAETPRPSTSPASSAEPSAAPTARICIDACPGAARAPVPPPLFIIDGVRVSVPEGGTSPVGSLNPRDIDHVEILKGVAAARLYGEAAANGVVLIYTKHATGTPASR